MKHCTMHFRTHTWPWRGMVSPTKEVKLILKCDRLLLCENEDCLWEKLEKIKNGTEAEFYMWTNCSFNVFCCLGCC